MRRFVTYLVVAAIAVAGALPPHHALAASHPAPVPKVMAHDHATHDHGAAAHQHAQHQHAAHQHTAPELAAPVADCDHHGTPGPDKATPDSSCCASACAAMAFIFAQVSFTARPWREPFVLPAMLVLSAAPPELISPPPRPL